ncbi:hypothetical protein SAMN04488540_10836 [Ferrimonas sediminum]|uniref:Uncharacterized protein n=1 Tax=Ferrimonas sediminum TaxID=718193 RepID=A0A1G8TN71_9GAMM|nr:hypothetical protein [Ferrimonas sediminum]SDJ42989.1 hypothetical protein SAMN04488540_10836 [Ferrimonas sediminum]
MRQTEMAQFGLFARQLIKQAAAVVMTLPKDNHPLKRHSQLQACLDECENRAMELVMTKSTSQLNQLSSAISGSVELIGNCCDHPGLSDADQHGLDMALANIALIHTRCKRLIQQADNVVPFPRAVNA